MTQIQNIALQPKNKKFNDLTFPLVDLCRITDQSDGRENRNRYSQWSSFNCDNTRLLLSCDNIANLYNFFPDTLQAIKIGPTIPGGILESAVWSYDNPDVIYCLTGWQESIWLRAFNVKTGNYSWVHDFTENNELPRGNCAQLSKSRSSDEWFSFNYRGKDSDPWAYAVTYNKLTNRTYKLNLLDTGLQISEYDECRLSRDGKKILLVTGKEWHLSNNDFTNHQIIPYGNVQRPGGHYDVGLNFIVNADIFGDNGNRIIKHPLADPAKWQEVFDSGTKDWTQSCHISFCGPSDDWALISTEGKPLTYNLPYQNMIFLVSLNGQQAIPLCYPRNSNQDAYIRAFANLSPDGRFFCFNSDWNTSHIDTYIGAIPANIWGAPPPTPTPTPTPGPTLKEKIVASFMAGSGIAALAQTSHKPSLEIQNIIREWMIAHK